MAKVYEFNNLENQIFYQNTNDIIYYTGEPRELGIFEREWLDNLKKETTLLGIKVIAEISNLSSLNDLAFIC